MVIATVILALVVVYYFYDPSVSAFFPKCPFRSVTGLPCAGCGSQRAIHALLHGDIAKAAEYNFMVVVFLPLLFILGLSSIFRTKYPKMYYTLHHRYVCYGVFAIVMLWWILRIVFHWYV